MSNQLANENKQQQGAQTPATQNNAAVKKFTEATIEKVLLRVAEIQATGDLVLPANYIPENAVRSAWLNLLEVKDRNEKPALDVCTPGSVSNAFLDMVTQGLSISKGQGSFIVYGNVLQFDRSYVGDILIAKRTAGVKDVNAVTVYEDDDFVYGIDNNSGRKKVIKHDQKLANIKMDKIVGVYAVVLYHDGTTDTEIMTMAQVRAAWEMGPMKGKSKAHLNFPDQMAEKTAIGRVLKIEIGSSDDSTLLQGRQTDKVSADVKHEIKEKAHTKVAVFEDAEIVDELTGEISQAEVEPAQAPF